MSIIHVSALDENRHVYKYDVPGAPRRQATIIFVGGEFEECLYEMGSPYSLAEWRVLAALTAEIEILSKMHKDGEFK